MWTISVTILLRTISVVPVGCASIAVNLFGILSMLLALLVILPLIISLPHLADLAIMVIPLTGRGGYNPLEHI